jgi:AcrR family transcriptional regulator
MPRSAEDRKQKLLADFRRSEILAAASKVFATKGFDSTRMEDIAKAARLAKGTLYLYFDSKDLIYQATVQQAVDKLAALTAEHVNHESTFPAKLAAFISVRIAFWQEQQQLYRIILTINRQGQHRKRSFAWQREAVQYLESIFESAAKSGEIPQQDFLAAAWTTMDAIRGVNERRVFADSRPSEARAIEDDTSFLTAFLLAALRAGSVPVSEPTPAKTKSARSLSPNPKALQSPKG